MTALNEKAADWTAASTVIVDSCAHGTKDDSFFEDPYLPTSLAEYKDRKMWVCFDVIPQGDGKSRKIPINPHTGNPAKINEPSTWGVFQEAKNMLGMLDSDASARYKPRFLGFAVTPETGIVFIDLDHVIDPKTGIIAPQAMEIIEKVNSYVELSQSGAGLHIYAKGKKLFPGCKKDFIEIYDQGRFSCITNRPYGIVRPMREATAEIAEIGNQYLSRSLKRESAPLFASPSLRDGKILARASSAKNSAKFKRLYYEGDLGEYGEDASAADQALMCILAFYTIDEEQLERLFSQSALAKRDKWQSRSDYRERTITAPSSVFRNQRPMQKATPLTS